MPQRPHVVFVTVDQWPAGLLGVAGHPVVETPTIDRLARAGTRFTNAYAECPVCIPARRSMMTGMSPRGHGDRTFQPALPMPEGMPTLAASFSAAGYQTTAIGKLHVFPKRDRIGFDDALIAEEGRGHMGGDDDYDMFLADNGHVGAQYLHGMSNNEYSWRTWHLPEAMHVTNWTSWAASRAIKRRDPTRPGFWHVSYTPPHPPLIPLASYLDRYRDKPVPAPLSAPWSERAEQPPMLEAFRAGWDQLTPSQLTDVRRAFYALCTHIDHQLRVVIGTLREENILDDTIILFCSDHGDMLGDYGLYAKRLMYEGSANVPMLLVVPKALQARLAPGTDDRLVGLQDIMPTLLDLCDIEAEQPCEGLSMAGTERRGHLYGEFGEGQKATRMVHDGRYKLIWYPAGNHLQLFDLDADPREQADISGDGAHALIRQRLETLLVGELYGPDLALVENSRLIGCKPEASARSGNIGLSGQRGLHYPGIPQTDPAKIVGAG
jgi:arylsulfatase